MRNLSFVLLLVLFAACNGNKTGDIQISGTAKNANYGTIIIKDLVKNPIFNINIVDGKFSSNGYLQYSGYYKMTYATPATKGSNREAEVYLEPGEYTIDIDPNNINDYPTITSKSVVQKQLSDYNAINDTMRHESRRKVIALNKQMKGDGEDVKETTDFDEVARIQAEEIRASRVDPLEVFKKFMAKYPDNEVAAHLMIGMDYQNDPETYSKLYEKFSEAAKSTDDGKTLSAKLKQLSSLIPGNLMPVIEGTTPSGDKLDIKAMHKKLLLIDFWRSTNGTSRDNHRAIINQLLQLTTRGFGAISVSLDTDKAKWLDAIEKDKMKWTQISDLKGDESPNGPTWGIKSIPAYYLVDGDGKIVNRIADFADVPAAVDEYFKSH